MKSHQEIAEALPQLKSYVDEETEPKINDLKVFLGNSGATNGDNRNYRSMRFGEVNQTFKIPAIVTRFLD